MVETVDMVAVTVEVTREAVANLTDRCPYTSMVDIGMHEELEVLTVSDILIECALAEVEELLELRSTVGLISDVDLTVALDVLVVHI